MTAAGGAVAASFCPAGPDAQEVERTSVTRSEALALVDLFWAEIEAARAGARPDGGEINLCLSRDPDHHFLEFAVFDPAFVEGRHRCLDLWKLLFLIPMRRQTDLRLPCRSRAEVAALVEAYLAMPDQGRFAVHMRYMSNQDAQNG